MHGDEWKLVSCAKAFLQFWRWIELYFKTSDHHQSNMLHFGFIYKTLVPVRSPFISWTEMKHMVLLGLRRTYSIFNILSNINEHWASFQTHLRKDTSIGSPTNQHHLQS
jgi:hypothetical protein